MALTPTVVAPMRAGCGRVESACPAVWGYNHATDTCTLQTRERPVALEMRSSPLSNTRRDPHGSSAASASGGVGDPGALSARTARAAAWQKRVVLAAAAPPRQRQRRPGSGSGGHLYGSRRPCACARRPSGLQTQSYGRVGTAAPPWSLSEAPPKVAGWFHCRLAHSRPREERCSRLTSALHTAWSPPPCCRFRSAARPWARCAPT